ncbi:MAG: BolA family transcriptional regulator [Deltaproteobacteria bacterium]|nr:BolA family transcriptional regulator [Deltaproteobacteria bacterium]
MISADAITARLKESFPDVEVKLTDLTGGQDHWQALIVTSAFAGLSPIARHRKVYAALAEEMKGPIHALTLTTLAPGEPRP